MGRPGTRCRSTAEEAKEKIRRGAPESVATSATIPTVRKRPAMERMGPFPNPGEIDGRWLPGETSSRPMEGRPSV